MTVDADLLARSRNELLIASITDIQGSVRANDAKANAALVVHGLLFAGLTTVLTKLGHLYGKSTLPERALGVVLLAGALCAFLRSVFALLRALSPYRNSLLAEALRPRHSRLFFPDLAGRGAPAVAIDARFDTLRDRLAAVESIDAIADELAAEIVKLDAIHHHESLNTQRGYRALRAELVAVAGFLVLVAFVAFT